MLLNFDRSAAAMALSASPCSSGAFLMLPIASSRRFLRLVAMADLPAARLDAAMVRGALRRSALA